MTLNYGIGQVEILPNMAGFGPALQAGVAEAGAGAQATMGKSLGAVDQRVAQSSKGFSAWGSSIKTAAGFAGIAIGAEVIKGGLNAAEGLDKSTQRMQTALDGIKQPQAMDDLQSWAKGFSDQTGILRGDILDMSSKLATMGSGFFKAVGPDAGKWITIITADLENMSAATGKSAAMLMRSLGPAILNTPEKAIPLLQKYGALTDAQAVSVKKLTDAGNNAAATQQLLLDIQSKYGGVAAKTATAEDHLKQSMNEAGVVIGQVLMPVISGAAKGLQILSPVLKVAGDNAGVLLGAFIGFEAVKFLPSLLFSIGLGLEKVGATAAASALGNVAGSMQGMKGIIGGAAALGIPFVIGAIDALGQASRESTARVQALMDALDSGQQTVPQLRARMLELAPEIAKMSGGLITAKDVTAAFDTEIGRAQAALRRKAAADRAAGEATSKHSADMRAGSGAANDLLTVTGPLAAAVAGEGAAAQAAAWNEQHLARMHHAVAQAAHAQWTAELELAGGLVGVETAAAQARDGQKKLQDLAAAGKTGTKEYSQALADQQGNVLALAGAVQTYEDEQKNSPAATAAALGALEALGSKYGLTKDQIDRMAASGLHAKSVIDGIAAGVNGLHDKTITITVQQRGDTSLHGGGGLAAGGPVNAGVPYMVGERGPELFVSDRPGHVVPNHALPAHSGGMGPVPTHSHIIEGRVRMEDSGEMFFRLLAQDVVVSELAHRGL